ncbi:MAG TPA: hypothetical protein VIS99_12385 [Terrimicrobiaceae bacterium]
MNTASVFIANFDTYQEDLKTRVMTYVLTFRDSSQEPNNFFLAVNTPS